MDRSSSSQDRIRGCGLGPMGQDEKKDIVSDRFRVR